MAERVTSPELRFRFVTKAIEDVGDYTDFPMEVTGASIKAKYDKIAEIFYRALKAQFTSNTLAVDGVTSGVTDGEINPRVMYSSGGGLTDNYLMTGYWTRDETPLEVYAAALPFLGDQYTEEFWDSSPAGAGVFRDINSREAGMLLRNGDGTEQPKWNNPAAFIDGGEVRTAFTWLSVSAAGTIDQPSIPIPWISQYIDPDVVYEALELTVNFTGRIGVVYGGAEGELYHPDNRFFIEMLVFGSSASFQIVSSEATSGFTETDATYTLKLSTGDLSCKLASSDPALTGNLDHEAVEWWPSARGNPAAPVWNTATGEKLA